MVLTIEIMSSFLLYTANFINIWLIIFQLFLLSYVCLWRITWHIRFDHNVNNAKYIEYGIVISMLIFSFNY